MPALGEDEKYRVSRERVVLGRPIAEDEVDLDSGFIMVPSAVPEAPAKEPPVGPEAKEGSGAEETDGPRAAPPPVGPVLPSAPPGPSPARTTVELGFSATRELNSDALIISARDMAAKERRQYGKA